MEKIIAPILILVVFITLVGAETYKQNDNIDFKKTCINDSDAACSTSTTCNVTIKYQNGSYLIQSGVMTNNDDGIFNYTIATNLLSEVGEYSWDMFCYDSENIDYEESHGTFGVTRTGVELSREKAMIYLGMLALLVFIFLVNMGAIAMLPRGNIRDEKGFIMDINSLKYLRAVLLVVAWALLLAITFMSSQISYLYLETSAMGDLLWTFYRIMMLLSTPMVVIWGLWVLVMIFQDKKIKNLIERGVPVPWKP